MGFISTVLLASALGAVPAEVSTLKGRSHAGELAELTAATLTLKTDGGEVKLPVSDLLSVQVKAAESAPADAALPRVMLTDGSRISVKNLTTAADTAALETAQLGAVSVPLSAVRSVRLGAMDSAVERAWQELHERSSKRDLLVIRKGNALDHVDGIVGSIDAQQVKFQLGREEVPVQREKVFGIIYARPASAAGKPIAEVQLAGDDALQVTSITSDGGGFRARLAAGPEVTLAPEAVRTLDFSLGKVRYLSQMDPEKVEYVPFFDYTWEYRRDTNNENKPLTLGGQRYARGLWIHSKTALTYRLGGQYRRFQAVMGIDENLESSVRQQPDICNVHVLIRGDGRTLLERDVKGTDSPQPLDLDVTGVRFLEIIVDFGEPFNDIGDHLDLADARVIK